MTTENETLLNVLAGVTEGMDDPAKAKFRAELKKVLPGVIERAGITAKLESAAVKPKMSASEANKIIDNAVKTIAARDGVGYDQALQTLGREKPKLIAGWQLIRSREQRERQPR